MAGFRSSERIATRASLLTLRPTNTATTTMARPGTISFKKSKSTTTKAKGAASKRSPKSQPMTATKTVIVTPQKRPASPAAEDASPESDLASSDVSRLLETPEKPSEAASGAVMEEKPKPAAKRQKTTAATTTPGTRMSSRSAAAKKAAENEADAVIESVDITQPADSSASEPAFAVLDSTEAKPKPAPKRGKATATTTTPSSRKAVVKKETQDNTNSINNEPTQAIKRQYMPVAEPTMLVTDQLKRRKTAATTTPKTRTKKTPAVKPESPNESSNDELVDPTDDADFALAKKPRAPRKKKAPEEDPPKASAAKRLAAKQSIIYKFPSGTSPFPSHLHPTFEESQNVLNLLSDLHGKFERPPRLPMPNLLVTGCGEVPSVLDALIRTLLSASTTATNSNRAFQGLVKAFGICKKRGSVDWAKVMKAPLKEVFEAIKPGGLADTKSKRIKELLDRVWQEGLERRQKQREEEEKRGSDKENKEDDKEDDTVVRKTQSGRILEQVYQGHEMTMKVMDRPPSPTSANNSSITTIDSKPTDDDDPNDLLTLDHLHTLPDAEILKQLTSYSGIGLKTASCVMLFCMARESFAVDTHVFRIARFLNWVPPDKATRETAFLHLDAKLPDEHKYALHKLFIRHGRSCRWCRAGGPLTYEEEVEAVRKKSEKKMKAPTEEAEGKEAAGEEEGDGKKTKKKPPPKKKVVKKPVKKEAGSDGEEEEQDELVLPPMCPLEHLVKRFHNAAKGRGVKWEAEGGEDEREGEAKAE